MEVPRLPVAAAAQSVLRTRGYAAAVSMVSPDDSLRESERDAVKDRAAAAAGIYALGGIAQQVLGFFGILVLARFIDPHDFGVVAFGTTLIASIQIFADGGLGVALIRQPGEVTRRQFEAVMGAQLVAATVIAAAIAAVAVWFGKAGSATAIMVVAVPIISWRSAGTVRVERELRYRPLVIVSLAEVVAYYSWCIPGVILGWNVWALATGVVLRCIVGTVLQGWLLRDVRLWPRLEWAPVRPLIRFGSQFVAAGGAIFLRDQSLNFGISGVGGLSLLGLWSFAGRLLQPINLLYSTLWRVTYPTMSRLLELDEDPVPVMNRIARFVAIVSSVLFVPLVVCSHAVVIEVFGARWADVSEIFPALCFGMLVTGPCSTAVTGYLFASGDAQTPRNAILAQFAAALVVTLPLLPVIGPWALGIGSAVGAIADTVVLMRRVRQTTAFSLRAIAIPGLCALLAALPFWLAVLLRSPRIGYELACGGGSLAVFAALLMLADRRALSETADLALRVSQAALRRQPVSAS
jgi:O-antigen/teichoic acid export membrane protein